MDQTRRRCSNPSCSRTVNPKYRERTCKPCRRAGYSVPKGNQHRNVDHAASSPPLDSRTTPATLTDSIVERNNGNERDITVGTNEHVRTLEDLIRVCEIDTELWDIVEWRANKWEMGWVARNENTPDKAQALPLFQITARMHRKSPLIQTMMELRKALVDDIKMVRVHTWPPLMPKVQAGDSDYLFEFSPFDLHMGKLTWDEETVTNYDVKIAEDLFNASLDYLLDRALRLTNGKLSRILCVFGNDVCHIDSKRGDTTAGTHMDVDSRYIKVYRRIVQIHRRAVDILREHAPVDIKIVPGNHDELTSFHLGEVLEAIYDGDPRVTIDNAPRLRKYYEFGTNLFGFAHGMAEKVSELPLLMARENPEAWARCASREWHIGHLHKSEKWEAKARFEQDMTSDKGIRVRRLTSMSGHDAWHTANAYCDRRACEAFVFHRTAGFTGHLSFNIDHHSGQALIPNE